LLSVPYSLFSKTTGGIVFSNDLLINGLTDGKGNGSVSSNTTLGVSALLSNTTGNDRTATGYLALCAKTTIQA
jgi:hypothetical protein